MNFAKFLRTPFLQNTSWRLLLADLKDLIYIQKQVPEVFCKKCVLKNFATFAGKYLCQSHFVKKETLADVFSCEFCEAFKNTFL